MNPLRALIALAFGSLLLTGLSADYIYGELSGKVRLEGGEHDAEVPLLLGLTNVRENVEITASCRLGSPAGDWLSVELDGVGDSGAANEGVLNLRVPSAWETRQLPLTLRCRTNDEAEDSEVFWNIRARARPRGGCTPSGCIGPQPRVSVEIGR
jgi:hypothetical protein